MIEEFSKVVEEYNLGLINRRQLISLTLCVLTEDGNYKMLTRILEDFNSKQDSLIEAIYNGDFSEEDIKSFHEDADFILTLIFKMWQHIQ